MATSENTTPAARFRVLGVNDEESTCQCCGKEGLKRVVWIADRETGSVLHFGTTCAQSPAKGFGITGEIKRAVAAAIRSDQEREQRVYRSAWEKYRRAGGATSTDARYRQTATDAELWASCIDLARADIAERPW